MSTSTVKPVPASTGSARSGSSDDYGFVETETKNVHVYVRTERQSPVCGNRNQCTIGNSAGVTQPNTCATTCSVNRLLEKSCTCGSGSAMLTCLSGEKCMPNNTCLKKCQNGQWVVKGESCTCGEGEPKDAKGLFSSVQTTCNEGEACHEDTGTCVSQACISGDGLGPTHAMCVCHGPTEIEVCAVGEYCLSRMNEKPCQVKCDGVVSSSNSCKNGGAGSGVYQPRTDRAADLFGRKIELKRRLHG